MKNKIFIILVFCLSITVWNVKAISVNPGRTPHFPNFTYQQNLPPNIATTSGMHLTKVSEIGGKTNDITINGNIACANEGCNLIILDISNPIAPVMMSRIKLGESIIQDISVAGNLALVCADESGSFLIDLSNPFSPVIISHLPAYDKAWDGYIAGNYAYIAEGAGGFSIYYIEDPYQPQIVYHTDMPFYYLQVEGNYCYLDNFSKITVLNISTPALPQTVAEHDLGFDNAILLNLTNNQLFIQDNNIMRIYDVSDPASLNESGSFTCTAGYPYDVKLEGSLAYLIDYYHLIILDLNDPADPQIIGQIDLTGLPVQLDVTGNYAYVGCLHKNVQVLDCSDPANPFLVSEWTGAASVAKAITINQDKVFLATEEGGMSIVDITNPEEPLLFGKYTEIKKQCDAVAVRDNYAFVADMDTLRVIDITDPQSLVQVTSLSVPGSWIYDIIIKDSHAWLATQYLGLVGVNINNPENLSITGNTDTPGEAIHLAISGNYAWVADGSAGLRGINISSPANPYEITNIPSLKYAYDVDIAGNYAWVVRRWNSHIYKVDISTPILPIIVDSIATQISDPYSVHVHNNTLFVAGGYGIQGFDISDPEQPLESIAYHKEITWIYSVTSTNEYLFAASDGMGLEIYKLPVPSPYTGILVTNTNDSGDGSLRWAIDKANTDAGVDTIRFDIPDSDPNYNIIDGVWHIRPATPLSAIAETVIIEGNSQVDYFGSDSNPNGPEIQIDGSLLSAGSGLTVNAENCEINGLAIVNFPEAGIKVISFDSLVIWGCYLGVNATCSAAAPNQYGLYLWGGCENAFIGPQGAKQTANIISGNSETGIFIAEDSRDNTITGNIIGLNHTTNLKLGNGYAGLVLQEQCNNNSITENIISGNGNGIIITESSDNLLENNTIGTNNSLAPELGNTEYGVILMTVAQKNRLSENFIWYNGKCGILVNGQSTFANTISRNSIAFNTDAGIKLVNNSNNNIEPPGQLHKTWTALSGVTLPLATVEFFCDQDGQGQNYLGDTIADNNGAFSFSLPASPSLSYYTLTATDTSGNTSAFSMSLPTAITEQQQESLPTQFTLQQNYPNPFNPVTTIRYGLPADDVVTLKVFDILGQENITLINTEKQPAGWHNCEFDASNLASGLYFYQLQTTHTQLWGKMMLVK